jgi:hypothetical protein
MTNGTDCASARKSRPVNEPEYCTSVFPASGEIPRPDVSNEESRVARDFSCHPYFLAEVEPGHARGI